MAANHTIKMIVPDQGNFSFGFNAGTGTTIQVPKPEEHTTVQRIHDRIMDGTIGTVGVTNQAVCTFLLRFVVEHIIHQNGSPNGQRPREVDIPLTNQHVAALANNVNSVERPQIRYMTIGGVETVTQFNDAMTVLLAVLGQDGLRALHGLLAAVHNYAIGTAAERPTAHTNMGIHAGALRDALFVKLGAPDQLQQDRQRDENTLAQRNASIANLDVQIAELERLLQVSRSLNETLQGNNTGKRRGV